MIKVNVNKNISKENIREYMNLYFSQIISESSKKDIMNEVQSFLLKTKANELLPILLDLKYLSSYIEPNIYFNIYSKCYKKYVGEEDKILLKFASISKLTSKYGNETILEIISDKIFKSKYEGTDFENEFLLDSITTLNFNFYSQYKNAVETDKVNKYIYLLDNLMSFNNTLKESICEKVLNKLRVIIRNNENTINFMECDKNSMEFHKVRLLSELITKYFIERDLFKNDQIQLYINLVKNIFSGTDLDPMESSSKKLRKAYIESRL